MDEITSTAAAQHAMDAAATLAADDHDLALAMAAVSIATSLARLLQLSEERGR